MSLVTKLGFQISLAGFVGFKAWFTTKGACLLLWRSLFTSHFGEGQEEEVNKMATANKTNGMPASVEMSVANLSLNVASEDEFKGLYEGYRHLFATAAAGHTAAAQQVSERKREALWQDLSGALAVIQEMLRAENAEWLFEALEYHGIPIVEDASKGNHVLPLVRLIMGYWPKKPKGWKAGDPEPAFKWDRSIEVYAKPLRAALEAGLTPSSLLARFKADKGYNKLKIADDKRNLKNDVVEQERIQRFKAVINDTPKSVLDAGPFELPVKDRPTLVALWAVVSADGTQLNVQGRLNTSEGSIEAHINRVSEKLYPVIQLRQERERADAAERKLVEMMRPPVIGMNLDLIQGDSDSEMVG